MAITQRLQFGKPLPIVKLLSVFQRFPVILNKEKNQKSRLAFMTFPELFCNSSHNALQFDADCRAICIELACEMTQIAV